VIPRENDNASPPPLPAPPHKLIRPKSPGLERVQKSEKASPVLMNGSPKHSRPSSRGSNVSAVSVPDDDLMYFVFCRVDFNE
jgi:hypothetical protein